MSKIPERPENIVHPVRAEKTTMLEDFTRSLSMMMPSRPIEAKVQGNTECKIKQKAKNDEPRVRISSQRVLISDRPAVSRDPGRLKDSTIKNRRDIRGDGVIKESSHANLIRREMPEFTRFV